MLTTSGFAEIGAMIGDPARANMLVALMDGRALTATELAHAAGVTPQTASSHLARLADAGLLVMERQGRHRYHRLASSDIARMLESIMAVAAGSSGRAAVRPRIGPKDKAMRHARTCYDHLAGRVAVALTDRMVERGEIELSADGGVLTEAGTNFLGGFGIDLSALSARPPRTRAFCRPCLDWSERRPHLAGAVGAAICSICFSKGWIRPVSGSRAVTITPGGRQALGTLFDLPSDVWIIHP